MIRTSWSYPFSYYWSFYRSRRNTRTQGGGGKTSEKEYRISQTVDHKYGGSHWIDFIYNTICDRWVFLLLSLFRCWWLSSTSNRCWDPVTSQSTQKAFLSTTCECATTHSIRSCPLDSISVLFSIKSYGWDWSAGRLRNLNRNLISLSTSGRLLNWFLQ